MKQIFPSLVDNVDVAALVAREDRAALDDRPWVLANMIASLDGAIAIDGVSGGLGGAGDKLVFSALRAVADVILVGSGTVIAENYRRPQTSHAHQSMRLARGQAALPRIAIVSASLSIDPEHRVFDPEAPPIVITHAGSPRDRRERLATCADVLVAGESELDLPVAMTLLGDLGANTVLLEGGPTLNGAMLASQLVDELCVTSSPTLVGGNGGRMFAGTSTAVQPMTLVRSLLDEDGFWFHRYLRRS